jgi:hypothetical protein
MAVFSGLAGDVQFTATAEQNVRNWTVTETAGVATGAHSDSSGWTDAAAGNKSWTGSFDFYQDATTSQPIRAGDAGAVTLTDGDANTYTGNVVVSEVSYSNDIEGAELVGGTVSFVGNGAFTPP